jgi:hypothetical protein
MFTELTNFMLGAGFNLAVALLIVRFIYYPITQDKKYIFTFLAFNTVIYFVLGLLTSSNLGVGVGFGLFAIFSVLRYRTDELPIREMTYLFIIIALSQLLAANGAIVTLLYLLEKGFGFHFEASKKITYEKIELITPANQAQLLADLRQRTGLPVKRAEVGHIDFLHDTVEIRIYYDEPALAAASDKVATGNSIY